MTQHLLTSIPIDESEQTWLLTHAHQVTLTLDFHFRSRAKCEIKPDIIICFLFYEYQLFEVYDRMNL